MKITICSSMAFSNRFMEVRDELEKLGYEVEIPDVEFNKDLMANKEYQKVNDTTWGMKARAISKHCNKVISSDAILVLNYEKNNTPGYIGANSFLEIGLAFAHNKKIFTLYNIPETSVFYEELRAINPKSLEGEIKNIAL